MNTVEFFLVEVSLIESQFYSYSPLTETFLGFWGHKARCLKIRLRRMALFELSEAGPYLTIRLMQPFWIICSPLLPQQ